MALITAGIASGIIEPLGIGILVIDTLNNLNNVAYIFS